MKRSPITRRLLAGAAGLLIGAAGVLAAVSPAQAHGQYGPKGDPKAWVFIWDDCDGTNVKIKSGGTNRGWRITAGGETIHGSEHPSSLWLGADSEPFQTSIPAEDAQDITVEWWRSSDSTWATRHGSQGQVVTYYPWKGPRAHSWKESRKCDKDEQDEEDNGEVEINFDLLPLFSCDYMIFAVRNNTEDVEVTVGLTPTETVTHGNAPGFLALLDEEPNEDGFYETPEDADLDILGELGAGDTFTIGPLSAGEAQAHGFEAIEGLAVQIVVAVDGEVLADETLAWDAEDLDCTQPEGGEGAEDDDQLPVTGSSTLLIAGGALALLALGGGLFLVARRRRVTFTA